MAGKKPLPIRDFVTENGNPDNTRDVQLQEVKVPFRYILRWSFSRVFRLEACVSSPSFGNQGVWAAWFISNYTLYEERLWGVASLGMWS